MHRLSRALERILEYFSGLAKLVHDAPGEGLLGREGARRKDQLLRAPFADGTRQRLRSTPARHDAERYFGQSKLRRFRRVGKIAKQDELEATRVGGAVDGGYHRDRAIADRTEHALEHLVLRAPLFVAERIALLQIGAGAKGPVASARDDNASAWLFVPEALEKFTQFERRSGVEGIGDLGAIERHQQYIAGLFFDPQRLAIPIHACRVRPRSRPDAS